MFKLLYVTSRGDQQFLVRANHIESDIPKAINSLSNGKVCGPDFISAEVFKEGGPVLFPSSPSFYNPLGSRRSFLKNPKIPPLFISTREKGTGNYATITKGFYC